MLMFFCAVKRRGAISDEEVESIRQRIVASSVLEKNLTHCDLHRPAPGALVVGLSNEPQGGTVVGDRLLWPCGTFWEPAPFVSIAPDLSFAEQVSRQSGRFSALLLQGARFAIGTPVARVDSVFEAENDDFSFFGNQASVLSVLRDGEVTYAPADLVSFISGGYFGSDDTPYAGVAALPPLTTIYFDGERLHRSQIDLADLKADGRSPEEILAACAEALAAAVRPLAVLAEPVNLGLTGGKDSRLILAALLHAGVRPRCHTNSKGPSNRADVWVASLLAERAGVDHVVEDVSRKNVATPVAHRFDLLRRTAETLRATDAMMGVLTPLHGDPGQFRPQLSLWGHGGECLRGGWAEYLKDVTVDSASRVLRKAWEGYPVFATDALARQQELTSRWMSGALARCAPDEVLDLAYLYFRVGRWVAAGSRGSASKVLPFLDNRFSREVLAMSAEKKQSHYLHRDLIARLLPAAADLPLADDFWAGTNRKERARIASEYPEAHPNFSPTPRSKKPPPRHRVRDRLAAVFGRKQVAGIAPPVVAHVRDYLVREGRLDLLRDVLDPDRTARFLRNPDPTLKPSRLFLGAYTAAVLLSEPWRTGRIPTRPIVL
jgi:hypothetical protein